VNFQRLLRIDWDVIAGIIAAVMAMMLSFLGLATANVAQGIILLLLALLLVRDLRDESRGHRLFEHVDLVRRHLSSVQGAMKPSDVHLIDPKNLRPAFAQFAGDLYGDVTWFNFCCQMFRRQEIFDATLRPIFDNPHVTSVHLLCNPDERHHWDTDVLPKLQACDGTRKLQGPFWGDIRGSVSFILGDIGGDGRNEALVAILDEPFAAYNTGPTVPRYILRLTSTCELVAHIEEVARHATSDFRSDVEAAAESGSRRR